MSAINSAESHKRALWAYLNDKDPLSLHMRALTFSMLDKKFTRWYFETIFLFPEKKVWNIKCHFFPEKKGLIFHANCLLRKYFAWNVKIYFLKGGVGWGRYVNKTAFCWICPGSATEKVTMIFLFYNFYPKYWFTLTLVLLNPDMSCLCKKCRLRSAGFWSQLIWICTICH